MGERPLPPGAAHLDATLATIMESAAQAMLLTDGDGRILLTNARAEALLERGAAHLLGQSLLQFIQPRDRVHLADAIRTSAQDGSAAPDVEATVVHRDGIGGLVVLTFLPFTGPAGTRVLLLVRDLTLERQARDRASATERDAERAEASDLRKLADLGRITSGIVHEVKTPLTYVNNNIELLAFLIEGLRKRHPELETELQPFVESAQAAKQGADRITRLLFGLRPLSQNRRVERRHEDLADVVVDAVRTFRGTHKGSTSVTLELESTRPVLLDRDEIVQVLLNLLNNAAAAMGEGGEIRVVSRNSIPAEVRVLDHGPGVHGPQRERLFRPFATAKKDGTGLGLYISRRIVEGHGGTLQYEDAPGGGACFVLRLPSG